MRPRVLLFVGLVGLIALVSAPVQVASGVAFAVALWVGWKLLTHRSGPLRSRGAWR